MAFHNSGWQRRMSATYTIDSTEKPHGGPPHIWDALRAGHDTVVGRTNSWRSTIWSKSCYCNLDEWAILSTAAVHSINQFSTQFSTWHHIMVDVIWEWLLNTQSLQITY